MGNCLLFAVIGIKYVISALIEIFRGEVYVGNKIMRSILLHRLKLKTVDYIGKK